ncbi:MAG: hypothetical protein LLF89_02745 [Spirochaetaceae bacterium]|nr:hypothetical protein [Spirochaetaceae bacterium]
MKRKARYLTASILSLAKPFLAGTIAVGISMVDGRSLGSFFLRYLILAQLIPSICLFFLYFDEDAYKAFKPLLLVISGISVILIAFCIVPIVQSPQKYMLATQNMSGLFRVSLSIVALLVIDITDFLIVISAARKGKASLNPPSSLPERSDNASND